METQSQSPVLDVQLDALVGRIFFIEDVTTGDPEKTFLNRYHGRLVVENSAAAYEQLATSLRPYRLTPLFRMEEGRQAIYLIPSLPEPTPSNRLVNLIMLVLTLVSVWFAGGLFAAGESIPSGWQNAARYFFLNGWPFAISIMSILGAHELGHYFMGRHHGMHLTLPYFIPLPLSPFGTMGAFINMKEPPKNRNHLLDIGVAGPFSGLIVAIPVLLLGLSLSEVTPLPPSPHHTSSVMLEGSSLFYLGAKYLVFGELLPAPDSYGAVPPVLYWARYLLSGQPLPYGGMDVNLHPVAWAGWAGLLVTALNLIPAGQLDGGHLIYVLFGRKGSQRILPVLLIAALAMGFVWTGWWLWALILFLLGRSHAEPLDQITPLTPGRKVIAILGLLVFALIFTPVPVVLLN